MGGRRRAWVHIVDLDAALGGGAAAAGVLGGRRASSACGWRRGAACPRRASPPRSRRRDARRAGRGRLLLQPGAVERACRRRTAIVWPSALDVRGGVVGARGHRAPRARRWTRRCDVSPRRAPRWSCSPTPSATARLAGPTWTRWRGFAEATGIPVLASGGEPFGGRRPVAAARYPAVVGAIVGRALADGMLTIEDALAAATID